jgi:solute carrier family 10 (sodium/bile acid cotransporter), member 7
LEWPWRCFWHGCFLIPVLAAAQCIRSSSPIGIALIFFLHGLAISFAALKAGTLKWRLHLTVQCCTFLFFPVLGLAIIWFLDKHIGPDLRLGIFYLCVLPSTVSSSVAMTAAARGNVPAAVFNATLSSLLGVFITPLWVGWMLKQGGHSLPSGHVLLDLLTWLVLPLCAGQICRRWLAQWAARNKAFIHLADRGTILLLVYTSFCDSMKWGVWSQGGGTNVFVASVLSLALFFVVLSSVNALCDRLGFVEEDRIAAVFCGSKKTLASGIPMAQLIFGTHSGLSLILLPIMIYHPMQLVICGWLAGRWAKRSPTRKA